MNCIIAIDKRQAGLLKGVEITAAEAANLTDQTH